MNVETLLRFWGKTKAGSENRNEFHPALFTCWM